MADLLVKMSVQDNLTQSIKQAKQAVSDFSNESNRMDKIQEKFDRLQRGTVPLKRQMRELQTIMAEMNFNGLSNTKEFSQIAQYAGSVADALGDARQAVNVFANDTMKLQATVQAFQAVTGAISIATGVMGLLGVESDRVQEVMLKVQSAIALVNGVQSIANLLNKDSALMLRIKQIAMQANTKATQVDTVAEKANTMITAQNTAGQTTNSVAIAANTVATGSNTVAIKAWNLVKAVSKALLGDFTGLLLVGATALIGYSIATSDSTKKIDDQNEATKKAQKVQERFRKTVIMSADDMIKKYRSLKSQYEQLSTTMQKKQFIKDNQSAFEDLGESINNVKEAQDYLIKNTSQVVANFRLIANEARDNFREKIVSSATELIDKYYTLRREWINLSSTTQKNQFIKDNQTAFNDLGGSILSAREAEDFFVNNTSKVVQALRQRAVQLALMDRQKQIIENYLSKLDEIDNKYANPAKHQVRNDYKGGQEIKRGSKQFDELTQMMVNDGAVRNGQAYNKDNKYYEIKQGKIIITEYAASMLNLSKTQSDYENRLTDSTNAQKEFNDQLSTNEKRIQEIAQEIGSNFNFDTQVKPTNTKHVKDFAQQISDVLRKYINGDMLFDDADKALRKINDAIKKKGLQPIDIDIKLKSATKEKLGKQVKDAIESYELGGWSREQASEFIENINKEAKSRGIELFNTNALLEGVDIKKIKDQWGSLLERRNSGDIGFFEFEKESDQLIRDLGSINEHFKKFYELRNVGDVEFFAPLTDDAEAYKISLNRLLLQTDITRDRITNLRKEADALTYAWEHGQIGDKEYAYAIGMVGLELGQFGETLDISNYKILQNQKTVKNTKKEYEDWLYSLQHFTENVSIDKMFEKWEEYKKTFELLGEDVEPPFDLDFFLKADKDMRKFIGDMNFKGNAHSDAMSMLGTLEAQLKLGTISREEVEKVVNKVNQYLEKIGLEPLKISIDAEGSISEYNEEMQEIQDTLKGMRGMAGQFYDDFKQLGDIFMSNANAGQKAGAAIATLGQTLQQVGGNGAVAKAGAIAAAIGQLALTFATSLKTVSTPWEWIGASLAGVATMAAVIGQISSFSQGGIVGGSSLVGDRLLMGNARVNSGEMILNGTQQKRLFDILDGSGINSLSKSLSKVEFVIDGKNLKGTLNNYNSKMNKVR